MDPLLPLLDLCCNSISKNQPCNYSDAGFSKDVYPPIPGYADPAIAMTILSVIFLITMCFSLRNIVILIQKRKELVIRQSLMMNIFVFTALTCRFTYILDGPIQLMSQSTGYSASTGLSIQYASIILMISNFAYSSYIWIRNILTLHDQWSKPYVSLATNTFFIFDMAYIIIMIPFTEGFPFINPSAALLLDSLLISIVTFINGVLFSIACYTLGKNLADIYEVDSKNTFRIKLLKTLAVSVAMCSLLRVFDNLFIHIFPLWQLEINVHSYCNKTCYWSLYLFIYTLFADIFPASFFLVVFSPETKGHNVRVPSSNNSLSEILKENKSFDASL